MIGYESESDDGAPTADDIMSSLVASIGHVVDDESSSEEERMWEEHLKQPSARLSSANPVVAAAAAREVVAEEARAEAAMAAAGEGAGRHVLPPLQQSVLGLADDGPPRARVSGARKTKKRATRASEDAGVDNLPSVPDDAGASGGEAPQTGPHRGELATGAAVASTPGQKTTRSVNSIAVGVDGPLLKERRNTNGLELSRMQLCLTILVAIAALAGAFFGGTRLSSIVDGPSPPPIVLPEPTPPDQAAQAIAATIALLVASSNGTRVVVDVAALAQYPGSSSAVNTRALLATSLGAEGGALDIAGAVASVTPITNADGTVVYATTVRGETDFQDVPVQMEANMSTVNGEMVLVMVGTPAASFSLADAVGGDGGSGAQLPPVVFAPEGAVLVFSNAGDSVGLTIVAPVDVGSDDRLNTLVQLGQTERRRARRRRLQDGDSGGDSDGAGSLEFSGSLAPSLNLQAPLPDLIINVEAVQEQATSGEGGEAPVPFVTGSLEDAVVSLREGQDTYELSGNMVLFILSDGGDGGDDVDDRGRLVVPVSGAIYDQSFDLSGTVPFWRAGVDGKGTVFQDINLHMRGARVGSSGEPAAETQAVAELTALIDLKVQTLNVRWPLRLVEA